ncbi:type I polyketide synthase [Rathayibacter iranicus]|uniref:KR domain-containing protein n=2 Tax=Rathayibacter iranicus TaxID=59737 RepID=A0AAD1ELT9_9MICO|nr:type I polyketide synthase [Rathayibacter iranicus]AZZ55050.1 KR domain-containing protein [Rathayibacter iranicus]MWV32229.1 type I polyketide synthase [Rathayibacter iranicus NCPPB 2253 = VKM Ac-1602]PPI61958.1 hypothetical protein C5E08_03470 [Rathayibacter iranicus]PWJ61545.1 acyl transferase domain-containing protein [Rathayibacter iranicus NCPPB 2253 = VKM Ac-1602]
MIDVDRKDAVPDGSGEFDIAITGMSLRFPGARSPEQFWQNLNSGVSSIQRFEEQELRDSGVSASEINDPRYVPVSGYLDGAGEFDAELFNIPRSEARIIDPQHRLFLECAWDALEDSGYNPQHLDGRRVGCYGGSGMAIYSGSRVNSYFSEYLEGDSLDTLAPLQAFVATQNDHMCMRVSHRLGLRGPSISVQTACSTGLVAVHLAAQSLLVGETDMALAGASGIHFPVKRGYLYEEGGILSPDGVCRPFDAQASGTVGGSGAAVVVLRRLEDAISDGDPIWAVVKGSAVNNDGAARAGYLAPSVEGQREVILRAQSVAGVSPQDIGFVEAHGTGTSLGDSIELTALSEVFGASAPRSVFLGSVKSGIGHLDTAAGMAGLIKAVLAVRHGIVPGTLNFREPNGILGRDDSPFNVSAASVMWPATRAVRLAGISSFGGGGTNAHVIVGPPPSPRKLHESGPYAMVLSGRTPDGLREQASAYADAVRSSEDGALTAICHTTHVGRPQFAQRAVVVAVDRDQLGVRLAALAEAVSGAPSASAEGWVGSSSDPAAPVRPVFLFSGQGSSIGPAAAALRQSPIFASALEECREASTGDADWFDALLVDAGPLKTEARLAQPALFAFQYALTRVWVSAGVTPSAVLGHSLGEYAAACASGIMTMETALALVSARGALMDKHCPPTGMLAVMASDVDVSALLEEHGIQAELAVINGDRAVVIGGAVEALAEAKVAFGPDVMTIPLPTTHAFHTSAMNPMISAFATQLDAATLRRPTVPIQPSSRGNQIPINEPGYWVDQVRNPVDFAEAFRLTAKKSRFFLEVGPTGVLTNLSRRLDRNATIIASLGGDGPVVEQLLRSAGELHVHGARVDFASIGKGAVKRGRARLPLSQRTRDDLWAKRSTSAMRRPSCSDGPPAPAEAASDTVTTRDREILPENAVESSAVATPAETLFGEVSWDDTVASLASPDNAPVQYWIVIVSAGHPYRASVLSALYEHGVVHSAGEANQLSSLRAASVEFGRLGILFLPDIDALDPWRAVADAAAILLDIVEPPPSEAVTDRVIVARFGANEDDLKLSEAGEAVDALVRCASVEHSQGSITSVSVVAEEVRSTIVPLLLSQGHEVRCFGGRVYARRLHRVGWSDPNRPRLDEDSTYVVSGGTGGLGRHVLRWLVERGARHIVVISRNVSDPAKVLLDTLREDGIDILMARADVSNPEHMRGLSAFIHSSMPPIRGVLHLAGILEDATLMNLDIAAVQRVFRPKLLGARELASMTSFDDLDFFIAFSSVASTIGSPGQSAYAAANASMEAVVRRARGEGRRGFSSVSWGPWSGAGMFASTRGQLSQSSSVLLDLAPQRAEELLDHIALSVGGDFVAARVGLRSGSRITWPINVSQLAGENWTATADRNNVNAVTSPDGSLAAALKNAPAWKRLRIFENYLCRTVSELLERPESEIDPQIPLRDFGVDSLYWVRLRNRMVADMDSNVSLTLIFNYPTILTMSAHLIGE